MVRENIKPHDITIAGSAEQWSLAIDGDNDIVTLIFRIRGIGYPQ